MQVSRWGNSLAIRVPASVVEVLDLHEGDEVEVLVAGERTFELKKKASSAELLARTEKDANGLADGLRFLTGMLSANRKKDGPPPPDLKMRVEGRSLQISIMISEEELRKAFQARRAAVERASIASRPPVDTGVTIQSSDKDMGTVQLPSAKKD